MGGRQTRQSVVEALRGRIDVGVYVAGDRLPSERELALDLSTSRGQIRSAIASLLEDRVLVQEPRCRPKVASREIKTAQGRIALWMQQDAHDIGATLILKGIRRVLRAAGRELVVEDSPTGGFSDPEAFAEAEPALAGVIVWPSDDSSTIPLYRAVLRQGIPLVCIDRDPPGQLDADVVAVDHFRGARLIVRHLIELGHRRIAMIGNDDRVSSVRDRVDGYCSALRETGIALDDSLMEEVGFVHVSDEDYGTTPALERLLRLPNPPTAIFAVNDQIAMQVQDAARGLGVRVPQDLSLAGFDWFLRWLPSGGDLTTVAQPFEQIGEFAAERLLARLAGSQDLPFHSLFPTPLVVKETTCAPNVGTRREPILSPLQEHNESYL